MKKKNVQAMLTGMAVMMSVMLPTTSVLAAVPEKEQTVYVTADESGKSENVIVSNWLKNTDGETQLTDKSELSNIQNVKGDEEFKQGSDSSLTWNADGKDIYYQGETSKELPVGVKLTYYLDGKEIQPSDLAGKRYPPILY
jgi:putative membrane protein